VRKREGGRGRESEGEKAEMNFLLMWRENKNSKMSEKDK